MNFFGLNISFANKSRYGFAFNRLFLGGQAEYISVDGKEYEIYQSNAVVRSVIDRRASMLANGIFKHYNAKGDEIENSELVNFLEQPNITQSRNEWLMQLEIQKCLYGNIFINKYKASTLKNTPTNLWNLSPQRIIVHRSGKIWKQTDYKGIVDKYEFINDNSANTIFDTNEILWITVPNPDDPVSGLSPLKTLHKEITNISLAMDYRNVIMAKKGALGILSSSTKDSDGGIPLTEQERKRLEDAYQGGYGIEESKSKVIITNSALTWNPMSYPTKDLLLFEEIDANKRAIIDTYGLNENIFSRAQGSTFTNVKEGIKLAYQDTIIPQAEDLARHLSNFLGLKEKGEYLELDYSHIPALQEDETEKATVLNNKANAVQTLKNSGVYSDAEIRDIIQLP